MTEVSDPGLLIMGATAPLSRAAAYDRVRRASAGISAWALLHFVDRLKVKPVSRRRAKRLPEPDCKLSGNGALAVHDRSDAIVRREDVVSEPPGAQIQGFKFIPEEAAGVDRGRLSIGRQRGRPSPNEEVTGQKNAVAPTGT
jgi:hypothetical protein